MMKIFYTILLVLVFSYSKELSTENNTTFFESNSTDSINLCLAVSEKDLKYCSKIQNKDEKSACFGILQRNSGYCDMVVDKDIKNNCLAIALSNIDYCKEIGDEKKQKVCREFYLKNESENEKKICSNK